MDLENTITATDSNAKKIRNAKEKINLKLIEKGATEAINLTEVPQKINEVVKSLKKIAIISPNMTLPIQNGTFTRQIPLNLNFLPKIVFIEVTSPDSYFNKNIFGGTVKSVYGDGYRTRGKIMAITKEYVKVSIKTINWEDEGLEKPSISKVWAIGE